MATSQQQFPALPPEEETLELQLLKIPGFVPPQSSEESEKSQELAYLSERAEWLKQAFNNLRLGICDFFDTDSFPNTESFSKLSDNVIAEAQKARLNVMRNLQQVQSKVSYTSKGITDALYSVSLLYAFFKGTRSNDDLPPAIKGLIRTFTTQLEPEIKLAEKHDLKVAEREKARKEREAIVQKEKEAAELQLKRDEEAKEAEEKQRQAAAALQLRLETEAKAVEEKEKQEAAALQLRLETEAKEGEEKKRQQDQEARKQKEAEAKRAEEERVRLQAKIDHAEKDLKQLISPNNYAYILRNQGGSSPAAFSKLMDKWESKRLLQIYSEVIEILTPNPPAPEKKGMFSRWSTKAVPVLTLTSAASDFYTILYSIHPQMLRDPLSIRQIIEQIRKSLNSWEDRYILKDQIKPPKMDIQAALASSSAPNASVNVASAVSAPQVQGEAPAVVQSQLNSSGEHVSSTPPIPGQSEASEVNEVATVLDIAAKARAAAAAATTRIRSPGSS